MMQQQKTRITQQTYLVLIRDGGLALAVAAALQDRLTLDSAGGVALVPATRGADFGDTGWDYLRQAAGCGGRQPQVVALHEDGLLGMLEALGLCAYVGVSEDQDWRVLHWDSDAGAMLLPVTTGRDLVAAVADHTPWHEHATAAAAPLAGRAVRKPRLVHPGPLSRKLALAAVAAPLLTVGLPAAVAAAQTTAPQAPVLNSAAPAPPSVPAKGTDPVQVNSWWQGLTPGQQQQVTNSNLAAIGSLDGIPAAVRDYANRQVVSNLISTDPSQPGSLPNQISSLTSQRDSLQSTLDNLPNTSNPSAATGNMALRLQSQINNFNDQLDSVNTQMQGLQALQGKIAPDGANLVVPFPTSDAPAPQTGGAPQMFLLGVDAPGAASVGSPNVGQFIVAVGNPDTAQNVATIVTGMNSKLDGEFVNYYVGAASNLQGQATVAAPGQTTSVITWYGYNAPQSVGNASWTAPAVAAAPALQQFQAGLYATNSDGSNLNSTVIGHSYGSVVLGEASQLPGGLDANQVTVVGSPGMNVPTADAVAAGIGVVPGSPQVFAGKNTTDIISMAPGMGSTGWSVAGDTLGHGTDPTKPDFGAIVFDTGNGQPGAIFNPSTGDFAGYSRAAHSEYFDWGNPALANMGNIVTGNFGAVTSQGTAALQQDLASGKFSGVLPPSMANEFGIPVPNAPASGAPVPGGTGIDGITSWPTRATTVTVPQNGTVNAPPSDGTQPVAPDAGGGGAGGGGAAGGVQGLPGTQSGQAASTAPGGGQQPPAPAPAPAGSGDAAQPPATTRGLSVPAQDSAPAQPASGQPGSGQPASGGGAGQGDQSGQPGSGQPGSGGGTGQGDQSGQPASGQPGSGQPGSGGGTGQGDQSGQPASGQPGSGQPASGQPASGGGAGQGDQSGQPASGQPASGDGGGNPPPATDPAPAAAPPAPPAAAPPPVPAAPVGGIGNSFGGTTGIPNPVPTPPVATLPPPVPVTNPSTSNNNGTTGIGTNTGTIGDGTGAGTIGDGTGVGGGSGLGPTVPTFGGGADGGS